MQSLISHTACGLALLVAVTSSARTARQKTVWQADIQIRTLEVTQTKRSMSVRVVIYTENNDEARNARLLFLLPVGVGIERLGAGCTASPGPSNVPALRAAVTCDLGGIPNQGFREVAITTTLPTEGLAKRVGVFAYSATPDPVPGNNYAERIVP